MSEEGLFTRLPDGKRISRAFYVYFVQAETMGLIKIGIARDIAHRVSSLQVGSPDKLRLLGVIRPDDVDPAILESELHNRFRTLRSHGEWFRPGPKLLTFIEKRAISLRENQIELATQAALKMERAYPAPHLVGITAAEVEQIQPLRIIATPRPAEDRHYPKGRKAAMERYLAARGLER